ncbi:MAG: hypothetical protein M1834_007437 [Cirrosporium novae-zelandiae]|nr:MAG: hypothetical protein M1834_007437 [Cirrosporium novae-zelandiae]
MTSDEKIDGDVYTLNRGYRASGRLVLQHGLWKDHLGWLVHPSIDLTSQQDIKVADIGTGNGLASIFQILVLVFPSYSIEELTSHYHLSSIWLVDLARQLPAPAHLDGFDISLSQIPSKELTSKNIAFHYLDACTPIPAHLEGQYDLVHLRLLVLGIRDSNPGPVLDNVIRLLKPGGYLQWDEGEISSMIPTNLPPTISLFHCRELLALIRSFHSGRKDSHTWVGDLPRLFEAHGLLDVKYHNPPIASKSLKYWMDNQLMGFEEASEMWERSEKEEEREKGRKLKGLIGRAFEESKRGAAICYLPMVVVGRKGL